MNSRIIFALLVLSFVCLLLPAPSLAVGVEFYDNAGNVPSKVTNANPLPITIASSVIAISGSTTPPYTQNGVATSAHLDASGSINVNIQAGSMALSGSLPLQYWGVGAPQNKQSALATNSIVLLTSLASFTANQYVEIQGNAKIRYNDPAANVASMSNCTSLAANEVKGFRTGTSTFNLAVMADPAAIASLSVNIFTLY